MNISIYMENQKDYKFMTPEEQMAWLTDFGHWSNEKLPVLCALGNAWEQSHIKSMEEGLKLISAFSYCRDFVQKSLMFRDFARRVDRIRFYVEKIKQEVAAGAAVKSPSGQTMAYVPPVQPRRRGRPTREEAAQMARERSAEQQQKAHADAVAKLTAPAAKTSEIATPQPKAPTAPMQGDLFAAPAQEAPKVSAFSAAVAVTQGEGRLHLDQLAWLMSKDLQMRIKEVAGLRAVAAKEAEQAKSLAENGVPQAVIEPHARAAVEAKDKYLAIYAAVDKELGELYANIYTTPGFPEDFDNFCRQKGVTVNQVGDILRPYWEKIGRPGAKDSAIPKPEETESFEEKSRKGARLHAIRTYFMRKDTKLTQKRIDKMGELIAEVQGYGLPTEEYEAVLAQAKKDFEEMMKE